MAGGGGGAVVVVAVGGAHVSTAQLHQRRGRVALLRLEAAGHGVGPVLPRLRADIPRRGRRLKGRVGRRGARHAVREEAVRVVGWLTG